MPIKSAIIACGLVALTMTTASATERYHLGGWLDGFVGSALAANRAHYGTGDKRCPRVRTSDRYGHYVGWTHTCMLPPDLAHGELFSRRLNPVTRQAE
jgi:hypothetical protein